MMRNGTLLIAACLFLTGCAAPPVNPSFSISRADAEIAWAAMKDQSKPLQRPVIVLGGIYDPGIAADHVASQIREVTGGGGDHPIIHIGFLDTLSFDGAAHKVFDAVNKRFPSDNPNLTVEVDVIGFSMGGLVARYAASDLYAAKAGRRLRIRSLFTVSSPHLGAKLAWVPTFDGRIIDMRRDSDFMTRLNAEPRPYEIIPYARLGDSVVGEHNAAPPGQTPHWIAKSFSLSHISAYTDRRILADIARRLRGEEPLAHDPAAPLP
jgi:hypothetical protein